MLVIYQESLHDARSTKYNKLKFSKFTSRAIGINTSEKVSFIFSGGLTAVMVQLPAFERTQTNILVS